MNRDFKEMLGALSEAGAEFMVIGAHAVAVYATPPTWPSPNEIRSKASAATALPRPIDPDRHTGVVRAEGCRPLL